MNYALLLYGMGRVPITGGSVGMQRKRQVCGFTLVEIMIVMGIIGLLSVIAIPSYAKSRRETQINRMVNDLRIVYDAFNLYAMQYGNYPDGVVRGSTTPQPVAEYLSGAKWEQPTVMGGRWLYVPYPSGQTYLLLVDDFNNVPGLPAGQNPMALAAYWRSVDEKIDDGNLNTGRFRFVSNVQVQYSLNDRVW